MTYTIKRFLAKTIGNWVAPHVADEAYRNGYDSGWHKAAEEQAIQRRTHLDQEQYRRGWEDALAAADTRTLVQRALKDFPAAYLDRSGDVLDEYTSADAQNSFLQDIHDANTNEGLHGLLMWLKRGQVLYMAQQAPDFGQIRFSRGTLNGFELVEEEIARYAAIYQERSSSDDEEYDPHSAV